MIDFLSPAWLLAGLAAAVPLFIHLMRRRIGTRIEFPAVRYLARAEREHSKKLRLKNLLLMLLRVAAVLLLALAAARPVARVQGAGHAPTALAIVLDNSLSTSAVVEGRTVLDELKARGRVTASRAAATDRLWLITADGVVFGGGRGAILEAIQRVEPLAGAGDMPAAVARAGALVRSAPMPEREIAVLTDGQATTWREPVSLGEARVLIYRPSDAPLPNRAVADASAVPQRWTPRGAVRARILTVDSATYRVSLDGRTLARGSVTRDEEAMVRAAPAERGWVAGTVELEPDELRGDDVRHFAVWIGPAPGVAVHPSSGTFAQSAVDALVQAERAAPGGDVAIVAADEATRLPAILLAPQDPVRAGAANRALERLGIPWRFGSQVRATSIARGERLDGVNVHRRLSLQARSPTRADTLARTASEPWIVAGPRYVLIASPLDPAATDLPVRAAFVPWLGDVISQRLTGEGGSVIAASAGRPFARPADADALELPDGETQPLTSDTVSAPARAGVYFFRQGERRVGAVTVNAEPDESALARLDIAALGARVRSKETRVVSSATEWRGMSFASAPRRPIVGPILLVAMMTLLAESVVAGIGRRRTS
ncbi:MAG TPA: VWA domain-containing protein [Gemmatimonadaceae bacterium]|nr:VWA domain-containing protein [Gemmatimonadaceae bacterium]